MTGRITDPGTRTAALVPTASRARREPWLLRCGYALVPPESALVAVADLTAPEGAAALAQLRAAPATANVPVLAIGPEAGAAGALELGADGFVVESLLEQEGALRLESLRRLAARLGPQASAGLAAPGPAAEEFFAWAADGFVVLDETTRIVAINRAGAQLLALDPPSARGRYFSEFATAISEPVLMEVLGGAFAGQACTQVDLELRAADERRLTIALSGSAAPHGRGLLLTLRDVTAFRQGEHELRKAKDFLEKLIDSSADAIVAVEPRGRVVLYNRGAEKLFGYPRAEALTLDARCLLPQDAPGCLVDDLAARDGRRLEPVKLEVLTRSGERVPAIMSAALVGDGERATASVAVFSDLRERQQLEAKLNLAEDQAEKRAFIVALAGAAAHELNQPLTSVMGYAELLKRRLTENDPAWRQVDIIYREAERMAEIIRKIGKITRDQTKPYVGGQNIIDIERSSEE